jgi:hypothetical protein
VSPADSGSPRAARRQERLRGPSNAREPALPAPEPLEPGQLRQPIRPNDQPEPPASVPPQLGNVPLVLPASAPRSPDSVRQAPPLSAPRRVPRAW